MERRNELKAKARELEHGNRPEEALNLYLQLVDRSEHPSAAIWARVGQLQLELGDGETAKQSLGNAISAFAESGHTNLAIALSRRLVETRAAGPDVHLRLGELALEKGYRSFAREALAEFARAGKRDRDLSGVVRRFVSFLGRFPDEQELWKDWVEELFASGRDGDAVAALRSLADSLDSGGFDEPAAAIRAEVDRLAAHAPSPTSQRAAVDDYDDEPAGSDGDDEPLPLLGTAPERDSVDSLGVLGNAPDVVPETDEPSVARLEGLQTSQGDWGFDSDPAAGVSPRDLDVSSSAIDDIASGPVELDPPSSAIEGVASMQSATDDMPPRLEGADREDDATGPDDVLEALESRAPDAGAPESTKRQFGTEWDFGAESPAPEEDPVAAPAASVSRGRAGPDGADLRSAITALLRLSPRQVDPADDPSTHYDLGVAFKEMGLFDESVAHLAMAVERGHDPVATLEVLGEMLIARGEYELTSALLAPLTSGAGGDSDLIGIHYWLGRSAEERGRADEAQDHYRRAIAIDRDFRDAADRLQRISSAF